MSVRDYTGPTLYVLPILPQYPAITPNVAIQSISTAQGPVFTIPQVPGLVGMPSREEPRKRTDPVRGDVYFDEGKDAPIIIDQVNPDKTYTWKPLGLL